MTQPADVSADPAPDPADRPAQPASRSRDDAVAPEPAVPDQPAQPAQPGQPAQPARRAGRNLVAATVVGLALGGLILATIYGFPRGFVAVMVVAFVIAVAELVTALMSAG